MGKWVIKLRIFLWSTLILVVAWLLYMGVVPFGKISYVYDFTKENYFIRKLAPESRVLPVKNGSQIIIEDPIYFIARTSRTFDKAVVTLKYKSKTDLPLVQLGVLMDKSAWNYELKPIENKTLDGYLAPRTEGDWKVAEAEFDLKRAYREFYKYSFLISVPGLKDDPSAAWINSGQAGSGQVPDDYLEIKEIKIDFFGTTLLDKIKRMIKR